MSDTENVGKSLKSLLSTGIKKLDRLSVVNILIIFALVLFASVNVIGDGIVAIIYSVGDVFSQALIKKPIHQNIDTTPIWIYFLFLFGGLVFCTFLVKKHLNGKLW